MSMHGDGFDARARAIHAASLGHLSPRVNAQLAQRRRAALAGTPARTSRSLLRWAGVATAGLALALVVHLRPPSNTPPTSIAVTTPASTQVIDTRIAAVDLRTARNDAGSDLSEDPDFYLWLGDARPARAE